MNKRLLALTGVVLGVLLVVGVVAAQDEETDAPALPERSLSRLHPGFALLDAEGNQVQESGNPLSTMQTCGQCHDTDFIVQHSQHSQVSLNSLEDWNPIVYRYTTSAESENPDLSAEAWVQEVGGRHVGGGTNPVSEMNCFLCHTDLPNNEARLTTLRAGDFAWVNSSTLLGTGILDSTDGEWVWNEAAFDTQGLLKGEFITLQDPTSDNCAACHGTVHMNNQLPLETATCSDDAWLTYTTGQIFSPQRMSLSALNLAGKTELSRSWDVHAERMVSCVDCHYALNNPTYYKQTGEDHPDHLIFDPRRLDISEYLYRPTHNLANGETLSEAGAVVQNDTVQPCQACHSVESSHEWLPYRERHTEVLACESCHIPKTNAPALQVVDWTSLEADSTPRTVCRGEEDGLLTGFTPILLMNEHDRLAPYNLISAWYWVYGEEKLPVPMDALQTAWFEGDSYDAAVLAVFDANADGTLDANELLIDSDEKETLIQARLEAQGLAQVQIQGDVLPYGLNHGIATEEWAVKSCDTCHTDESRVNVAMLLADDAPGDVLPDFEGIKGEIVEENSQIVFQTRSADHDLYIFGHDEVSWVNWLGMLAFFGTFAGVIVHGGLRYASARQQVSHHEPAMQRVYMYSVYERQWHWLQTVVIFILIFTGLIIHEPDLFGMFSFRYVVQVHNIVAFILLINAALAAFYHFASGEIRQFLPKPYGFFDQAFSQAKYYLHGIFKNEPHPFEKTPDRKMNPLQQMTYLVLLNVLLPLQIITGLLMWGAQRYPDISNTLGGLPYLAPFHALVAWLFASFIVMHVYLTTTGHTPVANIKAMMLGWEEVETLEHERGLS